MPQRTETDIARALLEAQAQAERLHTLTAESIERGRIRTIELARRYNMPWDTIGAVLGIKGDTARKQYERGF